MRWLDSITNSTDMNLSQLQEIVEDREAFCVTRSQRVGHNVVTENSKGTCGYCTPKMWLAQTDMHCMCKIPDSEHLV